MSNYTQSTNFATKDALSSGDPLKIVKGTEINTEFVNIAVAVATKADLVSPVLITPLLGTPTSGALDNCTSNTETFGTSNTQIATTAFVQAAFQALHPVGSIYINATNSTNPGTLLGFGTWSAFGAGRVMVGLDATQTEFDTAEETGGAKTHTLTTSEIPAHTHSLQQVIGDSGANDYNIAGTFSRGQAYSVTGSTGGGAAHNNLQPYITVYLWKRTA